MIAYIDSSVLLRLALGQPGSLREWPTIQLGVTSTLTEVECLRTLDRQLRMGRIDVEMLADFRSLCLGFLERMDRVDVAPGVLRRAADPFPTPLGTLDAIHLATALLLRDAGNEGLAFATHDRQLAIAARASGFRTIGL